MLHISTGETSPKSNIHVSRLVKYSVVQLGTPSYQTNQDCSDYLLGVRWKKYTTIIGAQVPGGQQREGASLQEPLPGHAVLRCRGHCSHNATLTVRHADCAQSSRRPRRRARAVRGDHQPRAHRHQACTAMYPGLIDGRTQYFSGLPLLGPTGKEQR